MRVSQLQEPQVADFFSHIEIETKGAHKMRNILRKVRLFACYGLLAFFACLLVYSVILKAQNKPAFTFGKSIIWIVTDSMDNTIPANTFIMIEEVDTCDIHEGDIITFYSDDPDIQGKLNTHRVVTVLPETGDFETKGDNAKEIDETPAAAKKVIGRYVRNLSFLTAIGRVMVTGYGVAVIIAVFISLFGLMLLPELIAFIKNKMRTSTESKDALIEEAIRQEVLRLQAEHDAEANSERQNGSKNQIENTESEETLCEVSETQGEDAKITENMNEK